MTGNSPGWVYPDTNVALHRGRSGSMRQYRSVCSYAWTADPEVDGAP
jgi:hypothetical protein